jgi:hypothetical protein
MWKAWKTPPAIVQLARLLRGLPPLPHLPPPTTTSILSFFDNKEYMHFAFNALLTVAEFYFIIPGGF